MIPTISLDWSDPPMREVAVELHITEDHVRRLLRDGELAAYRLGREVRVMRASIDRLKARSLIDRVEFATGSTRRDREVADHDGEAA